jgi:hypothetical protein
VKKHAFCQTLAEAARRWAEIGPKMRAFSLNFFPNFLFGRKLSDNRADEFDQMVYSWARSAGAERKKMAE